MTQTQAQKKAWGEANPGRRASYHRSMVQANRAMAARLKVEKGCADCGYNARSEALDFDHLPGLVKRLPVSRMMTHSKAAILLEISKCEVVCANCHRIRTADRKL